MQYKPLLTLLIACIIVGTVVNFYNLQSAGTKPNKLADKLFVAKVQSVEEATIDYGALNAKRLFMEEGTSVKGDTKAGQIIKHDVYKVSPLTNDDTVLVYSAHYDERSKIIKIVGFGPMLDGDSFLTGITCRVKYPSAEISVPLKVYYRISTFFPWNNQKYDNYLFMCETFHTEQPDHIVLLSRDKSVTLQVTKPQRSKYKFAVCVKPTVFQYNDVDSIRHFIAVNSMFGAEHFYFYNASIGSSADKLLHELNQKGIITVYPWHLGDWFDQIHSYGQKASHAHCLYAHRHAAEFLVFIDIDEVLTPITTSSWTSLLDALAKQYSNSNPGAFSFRSKLFPRSVSSINTANNMATRHNIWSVIKTQSTEPYEFDHWSKLIVNTKAGDVVDIHTVRKLTEGYDFIKSTPEVGLIYHYRSGIGDVTQLKNDTYMLKFTEQIISYYNNIFGLQD